VDAKTDELRSLPFDDASLAGIVVYSLTFLAPADAEEPHEHVYLLARRL
jgi:hypothetical protein